MRISRFFQIVALAVLAITLPAPAFAQVFVGIGVSIGPPALPYYQQPILTQPNYIWQPGYWAWGSYGYYWVPGTWVGAPQPGLLWTPGYWAWNNGNYFFQAGYWAPHVGYYGGVNYGGGYFGSGFVGGSWIGGNFRYNTYVSRVNNRYIRNVYSTRVVINNNRVSYYGGPGGLRTGPTPQERAVANMRHYPMTAAQTQNLHVAAQNRNYLDSVNHGRPAVAAVARPLSPSNRPAGFRPVTAADRTHVAATTVKRAAPAHPVTHAAPARPVTHAAPARPVTHAAPARPVTHEAPARPVTHAAPARPATHAAPARPATHTAPARPMQRAPRAAPHMAAPHPAPHAAPHAAPHPVRSANPAA